MRDGFNIQMFKLANGAALPEFPNYRPRVTALGFVDMPTNGINARIERVVCLWRRLFVVRERQGRHRRLGTAIKLN
jgi:hypothetical protein